MITLWDFGIVSKVEVCPEFLKFSFITACATAYGPSAFPYPIRMHHSRGLSLRQDAGAEGARSRTRPCGQVETRPERQKLQSCSPHWKRRLAPVLAVMAVMAQNLDTNQPTKCTYLQWTHHFLVVGNFSQTLGKHRTQRTLHCFHELVNFRFFQTPSTSTYISLSQGCEKKTHGKDLP